MSELKRRENDVVTIMQWITRIGATVAAVGIIGGAVAWAADTRYAQKTEVRAVVQEATDGLRKSTLEDKIFELNLVPPDKRTDVQRALLDRYVREIEELRSRGR
jgi:hypothetical protein